MVNFIAMYPPSKQRYCARCNTLVNYTEKQTDDAWQGHQEIKQFCVKCGTCVGMRLPIKQHERWVIDPYQKYDDEPMTVDEYMHMKGV